jgi:hypothetical protein
MSEDKTPPTARELLDYAGRSQNHALVLASRVEAVLALHKCVTGEDGKWKWCDACGGDDDPAEWPCPTRRALEGKP